VTPDEEEYGEEEEEEDEEEEGENEYLDEETVDEFEDRVLNKRAAQLHCRLRQRMVETPVLAFASITKRKDTRKIAAQKFYSLLVLQKFMAVELAQGDECYGEMQVSQGKQFELDTSKVKAK
jgi:cohesin complex subunit SCC1